MRSSAGVIDVQSPARVIDAERRSATALAAIALTALALSLLLAFVSTLHRQPGAVVQRTTVSPAVTPAAAATVTPAPPAVAVAEPASAAEPQSLYELLAPWAVTADVLAMLGLAAVLALRRAARRRGPRS